MIWCLICTLKKRQKKKKLGLSISAGLMQSLSDLPGSKTGAIEGKVLSNSVVWVGLQ